MYVKIPGRIAHIIDPEAKNTFPTTYCGMAVLVHGKHLKEIYKGNICPECERMDKDRNIDQFIREHWGTPEAEQFYHKRIWLRDDDLEGIRKIYDEMKEQDLID